MACVLKVAGSPYGNISLMAEEMSLYGFEGSMSAMTLSAQDGVHAQGTLTTGWGPNAPEGPYGDTRWAYKPFSALSDSLLAEHNTSSWLLPGNKSPVSGKRLSAVAGLSFQMNITNLTDMRRTQLAIWGGYELYGIVGLAKLTLMDKGMNMSIDWRCASKTLAANSHGVDASQWHLFLRSNYTNATTSGLGRGIDAFTFQSSLHAATREYMKIKAIAPPARPIAWYAAW